MNAEPALLRLGTATAEGLTAVLETIAPGAVGPVNVTVTTPEETLAGFPFPAVVTRLAYVDGITGGNLFALGAKAARRLAAAMAGGEPADSGEPLSELELSAVSEATNQMLAAAAGATGAVLGQDLNIDVPHTDELDAAGGILDAYAGIPHAVTAGFTFHGEPCRLVQLVPSAFVVRLTRALDDRAAEAPGAAVHPVAGPGVAAGLRGLEVTIAAELGRTRMATRAAVTLPEGAVVELDPEADAPVDLCVNGTPVASGRLLVVDGAWALRIEQLETPAAPTSPADPNGA